jgi:hypothetical protein
MDGSLPLILLIKCRADFNKSVGNKLDYKIINKMAYDETIKIKTPINAVIEI